MKKAAITLEKMGVILAGLLLCLSIGCTTDDIAPEEALKEANIQDINMEDEKEPDKFYQ